MKKLSKFNKLLLAIFSAQIVFTGVIYVGSQASDVAAPQTALLSVDKTKIDRVIIENKDQEKVLISKVDERWQLPDYHQLPADTDKVVQALDKLANTKSGWPIATSENSHERFEVNDDTFKTRITLSAGNQVIEKIYLGTSPGFRQVHARMNDANEVYSVKLNEYEYPAENESWLDRGLLRTEETIAALSGPDFKLEKQNGKWKVLGKDNLEVVKEEAQQLVTALNKLSINKVVDKKLDQSAYSIKVKDSQNEYEYHFYKDADHHYVTRDDQSLAFEISQYDYEKITGKTSTQLVKHIDAENPDTVANNKQGEQDNNS